MDTKLVPMRGKNCRKSDYQLKVLNDALKQMRQKPSQEEIKPIAKKAQLTNQQTYKWFWDQFKNLQNHQNAKKSLDKEFFFEKSPFIPSQDEFGGY